METQAVIKERQTAARQWAQAFDEKMKVMGQPQDRVARALMVIVLCGKISDFLAEHDPQSLKQAQQVLESTINNGSEMSLDEAIAHAEEVGNREECGTLCGLQHLQLATWLKELKTRQESN